MERKEPLPNPVLDDVLVLHDDDHICVLVKPEGVIPQAFCVRKCTSCLASEQSTLCQAIRSRLTFFAVQVSGL
jgi:23S rRNA-/tRNA-specific pseudouridylate synthase